MTSRTDAPWWSDPTADATGHRPRFAEILYEEIRARWSAFDHPPRTTDPRQLELPFPPDNLTP